MLSGRGARELVLNRHEVSIAIAAAPPISFDENINSAGKTFWSVSEQRLRIRFPLILV